MTLALSLFFFWLALWLLQRVQPKASLKKQLLLLLFLTPWVIYPFVYSPLWWLRGLTGDLSIVSLFLLASALNQQLFGRFWLEHTDRKALEIGVVVFGLCFYPLALGLGFIDPYAWGYSSLGLVVVVSCIAALALFYGNKSIAVIIILALAAWHVQLLQSVNLWDYLLDPFIFFFYLGRVVRCMLRFQTANV